MPWTRIYYPEGAFSAEDKKAIAKGITDIYAESYPRGGTLVVFIPIESDALFKGGELTNKFVRITLQHMSGSYTTYELENVVRVRFRNVWKPYIEKRGLGYELQIEEISSNQITFDNYTSNTFLGEPLFKEMVEKDQIFSLKTVKG